MMVAPFISKSKVRESFRLISYWAFLLVVTVTLDLSAGSMKKSIPSISFSSVLPGKKKRRGSLGPISSSLAAKTCPSPFSAGSLGKTKTLIVLSSF